jgi:hypothetical protein
MKALFTLLLGISLSAFAHDEGHGPKLKDVGRRGGRVTAVVLAKDAGLGAKAPLVHKGEIVRSKDGTIKVFFYDQNMGPLKLDGFAKTAKAILISGKEGKETEKSFELTLHDDHLMGKAPKPDSRRYNIDVKISEGDKELLAAFDNLD